MVINNHNRHKGSGLFLVRLKITSAQDSGDKQEWHGKVQRVVDGESHQFSSLQGLTDLLQAMFLKTERR